MEIRWSYKHFNELTTAELYEVLKLRSTVFVVEQNCVYLDIDNKDKDCWHLMGWLNEELAAYSRIIPPGLCFKEASIGRVVTNPKFRKEGFGKQLMLESIERTILEFQYYQITIGAQLYLHRFYTSLGFVAFGEQYLEDGIPHIHMRYSK